MYICMKNQMRSTTVINIQVTEVKIAKRLNH